MEASNTMKKMSPFVAGSAPARVLSFLWRILFIGMIVYSNIIVFGIYPRLF